MFFRHARTHAAILPVIAVIFSVAAASQTPTVDEIVDKYLEARGGADKLRAVNTVKMTGRIKQQAAEIPIVTWAKRPNLMRRENTNDGQTFVLAFDGKTVWAINPLMSPAPRQITGPAAEMTMQDTDDFDSALLDYKQKGYTVELLDSNSVGGVATRHLRVKKKNGRVQDIYLSADTLLESKITMDIEQGGRKGQVATEFSNYKAVDGIMVPFRIRQSFNGQPVAEATYTEIQFNAPIDDGLFKMPKVGGL
jgi:outer membrane lipoprotein-sorting protein